MSKRDDFFQKLKDRLVGSCKSCGGSGWLNDTETCPCLKKFEMYWDLESAGIDREYWDLTFDDFKGDALAKKKVVEYLDHLDSAYDNGLGLVLYGTNGTGKTMLSSLVLKKAHEAGKSIRFITMAEMTQLIKSKIDRPDDAQFYEDGVKNSDFLCLDNLGSEYRPQNFGSYTLAEFDVLARHRRRNFLCTILTTNLSMEEFLNQYGSSIASLFSACSMFIQVAGKDYRAIQGTQYSKKLKGTN